MLLFQNYFYNALFSQCVEFCPLVLIVEAIVSPLEGTSGLLELQGCLLHMCWCVTLMFFPVQLTQICLGFNSDSTVHSLSWVDVV